MSREGLATRRLRRYEYAAGKSVFSFFVKFALLYLWEPLYLRTPWRDINLVL